MYRKSFQLLIELRNYLFMAVVLNLVLYALFLENSPFGFVFFGIFSPVIWTFLFLAAFQRILLPRESAAVPHDRNTLVFFLWNLGIEWGIFCLLLLLSALFFHTLRAEGVVEFESYRRPYYIIYDVLNWFFLLIAMLSIGTIFPAIVSASGKGLRAALRRAKPVFSFVLTRMLIGPIAIYALDTFCVFLLEDANIVSDNVFDETGTLNLSRLLVIITSYVFGGLTVVMTAVIFSDAYLKAEKLQEYPETRI